jgi:acetyltransferase-like isoleucine patch superfamily enzyme
LTLQRSLLERAWTRAGLSDLDPALDTAEIASMLTKIGLAGVRGLTRAPRTKGSGYLFVGRRAVVRSPHRIHLDGLVFAEDDVELQATSRRGIHIGHGVTIGRGSQIRPSGYYGRALGEGLVIGEGSNIGPMSYIGCAGFIEIGRKVMMGPGVMLLAEQHSFDDGDRPMKDQGVTRQGISIDDDVWLGARCAILDGVHIGRGAIVATNAVVTSDVAPGVIVGGVPARRLRDRSTQDLPDMVHDG